MKWGRLVTRIARGRRRQRKFVNFAITAILAFNRRGFVIRRGNVIVVVAWGRRRRRRIRITSGRRKRERRKECRRISRMRRLRDRASLIILKVFSEEMVGWGLRSSEPCGCTLTLRDRFLWLSVLVRVGAERWGQGWRTHRTFRRFAP